MGELEPVAALAEPMPSALRSALSIKLYQKPSRRPERRGPEPSLRIDQKRPGFDTRPPNAGLITPGRSVWTLGIAAYKPLFVSACYCRPNYPNFRQSARNFPQRWLVVVLVGPPTKGRSECPDSISGSILTDNRCRRT
jgi:hypothetical protein